MPARTRTYARPYAGGAPPPPPPTGIQRIYADGTNGNDANNGSSWALAFKSTAKCEEKIRDLLLQQPLDVDIILFLRGAFTGGTEIFNFSSLTVNTPAVGKSRVHIVHPVFESIGGPAIWALFTSGNVVAVANPGKVHTCAQVQLSNITNVRHGQFIRFRNQAQTLDMLLQILKVWEDAGNYYVIVSCLWYAMPAWIDGTATFEVYSPTNSTMSGIGTVTMHGSMRQATIVEDQQLFAPATLGVSMNMIFGLYCLTICATGSQVAIAGCVPSTIELNGLVEGAGCFMTDTWIYTRPPPIKTALMQEFGLGNWYSAVGAGEDYQQIVGNASSFYHISSPGQFVYQNPDFGLMCANSTQSEDQIGGTTFLVDGGSIAEILCSRIGPVEARRGGSVKTNYSLVGKNSTSFGVFSCFERSNLEAGWITWDVGPQFIQNFMFLSKGGFILTDGSSIDAYPGFSTQYGYNAVDDGVIVIRSGLESYLPIRSRLMLSESGGLIKIEGGTMTIPSYPGTSYPDIELRSGGRIVADQDVDIVKQAPNTNTNQIIRNDGGEFFMDMTRSLTLPASANAYIADYGGQGAFWIKNRAYTKLGNVTGGSTGGGTALYLKRASHLIYASSAIADSTNTAAVVGALAAGNWAPTTDPTELCILRPDASP